MAKPRPWSSMHSPLSRGARARWAHAIAQIGFFVAVVTLAATTAPLLLGPALTPLVRALGTQWDHLCACGMTAGKCGCAACAQLTQERRTAAPSPLASFARSGCDDDDEGVAASPSLAP